MVPPSKAFPRSQDALQYNLGFVDRSEVAVPHPEAITYAAYPPLQPKKLWPPGRAYLLPLPLSLSDEPIHAVAAAKITVPLLSEIEPSDRAQVCLSPIVLVMELATGKVIGPGILVKHATAIHCNPADTRRNRDLE